MRAEISKNNFLNFVDQLGDLTINNNAGARWANRILICGLILFALTLPHSIAAMYISLSLCVAGWLIRDLALRQLHFSRTPIDKPLLWFSGLTVISAVLSIEPGISLPKIRTLIVFAVLYLCVTNLHQRAVNFFLVLLIISSLAGVLFSLGEKIIGRGMIVTAINNDSPFASSPLQIGDVIWLFNRKRVSSLAEINRSIKSTPDGQVIEIEALHYADPLPIEIKMTESIKAQSNPLGIAVDGRSRRFRVSGFSRHFLTYAEQMQLFALLTFGAILRKRKRDSGMEGQREEKNSKVHATEKKGLSDQSINSGPHSLLLSALPSRFLPVICFLLYALALVLTASRAVIASFLLAMIFVASLTAGRRIAILTILTVFIFGGVATYILISTRSANAANFADDSSTRRIGYMKAGLKLIPQHPIFGVGIDAHKKHWSEWGFPGDYITHTHSTPIQIALDRGLPALGCYFWLIITMGLTAWRSFRKTGDWICLGALAALIGFFLSSLTNYNFGDSEVLILLLFIFGLVIKKTRNE